MSERLTPVGQFQSDKYPTFTRGKVPLSCKDPMAQDLLWEYARRRRSVDAEFSDDLEQALKNAGYCRNDEPATASEQGKLTPRQAEVLEKIGLGKSNKAIAHELHMSPATVKAHVFQIMRKLGCENRMQAWLLAKARSSSYVPLSEL